MHKDYGDKNVCGILRYHINCYYIIIKPINCKLMNVRYSDAIGNSTLLQLLAIQWIPYEKGQWRFKSYWSHCVAISWHKIKKVDGMAFGTSSADFCHSHFYHFVTIFFKNMSDGYISHHALGTYIIFYKYALNHTGNSSKFPKGNYGRVGGTYKSIVSSFAHHIHKGVIDFFLFSFSFSKMTKQ